MKNYFSNGKIIFLVFSILINSCSKVSTTSSILISTATADFNYSNDTSFMSKVVFNNTSINAKSYSWQFGDGQTSDIKNPIHVFNNDGIYKVTLNAFDSLNVPNTKSQNIIVKSTKGRVVFYVGYLTYSSFVNSKYEVKAFQYGKDTIWGSGKGNFYSPYFNVSIGYGSPDCKNNLGYTYTDYQDTGEYYYVGVGDSKTTSEINKFWNGKYNVIAGTCNKVNVAYR